ncbi:MAG: hypothetical protein WA865_19125 [Spirulinaceae cyanobacterium]
MPENNLAVNITLFDSQLSDEQLQEDTSNLREEIMEVEGVQEANLVPITQAPVGSKGIGDFLMGQLEASITVKGLKTLANFLGNNLYGKKIKIKAEGNGKKLDVEINRPEDLQKIMPEIDEFING